LDVGEARDPLLGAVVLGLLAAAATVVQAILLGEVASRMLLDGATREWLVGRLAVLLCAVVARAVFVWMREVVASRGAASAKRRVRGRVVEHVFALGPAYGPGGRAGGWSRRPWTAWRAWEGTSPATCHGYTHSTED
jgi:ABC-type transport system involved in cytochrome bd biosynthesis fused ATPase/permease subunit